MFKHNSLLLIGLSSLICATSLRANPVVDHVAVGDVQIQQDASAMVVNQASQKAIIDWKSFNIAAGESTHFQQPHGGVALNRINASQGASQIYGHLSATGQIILTNAAGFFFGPSAYVNVGSMVASTADMSEKNFMRGHYIFDQISSQPGSITNQGKMIAEEHGLIALLGNGVSNEGLIQAQLGAIYLSSGESFSMIVFDNALYGFKVEGSASKPVENTGTLSATSGVVVISANDASGILDRVINLEGVVDVKSVGEGPGGVIYLDGGEHGEVRVNGELNATSGDLQATSDQFPGAAEDDFWYLDHNYHGGHIAISGYNIRLDDHANLNVSSIANAGGVEIGWLNFFDGPDQGIVDSIFMANGATINANSMLFGGGGWVDLRSDGFLDVRGTINARTNAPFKFQEGGVVTIINHEPSELSVENAKIDVSSLLVGNSGEVRVGSRSRRSWYDE